MSAGVHPFVTSPASASLASTASTFRFQFEHFGWGGDWFREHGEMMPADGLDALRDQDAILFGSAGDPHIPDHVTLWGLRLIYRLNNKR